MVILPSGVKSKTKQNKTNFYHKYNHNFVSVCINFIFTSHCSNN